MTHEPLWSRYFATRSMEDRNALCIEYAYLSKLVVNQYWGKRLKKGSGHYISTQELFGAAHIGLIAGVERYDPTKGAVPETFLRTKIYREVQSELQRLDFIKKSDRAKVNKGLMEVPAAAKHIPLSQLESDRRLGRNENVNSVMDRAAESPDQTLAERVKEVLVEAFRGFKRREVLAILLRDLERLPMRDVYRITTRRLTTADPNGCPGWFTKKLKKSPFLLG